MTPVDWGVSNPKGTFCWPSLIRHGPLGLRE
jgi:hypothetical protein